MAGTSMASFVGQYLRYFEQEEAVARTTRRTWQGIAPYWRLERLVREQGFRERRRGDAVFAPTYVAVP